MLVHLQALLAFMTGDQLDLRVGATFGGQVGRRNYAVLLLLARLGLHAGEAGFCSETHSQAAPCADTDVDRRGNYRNITESVNQFGFDIALQVRLWKYVVPLWTEIRQNI